MSNVIEFHRPVRQSKQVEATKSAPKLADIKDRGEWKKALAAIWAAKNRMDGSG